MTDAQAATLRHHSQANPAPIRLRLRGSAGRSLRRPRDAPTQLDRNDHDGRGRARPGTPRQVELSTDEAACFVAELVGAGTETTAKLLGWACLLLDGHPHQRARLVADPSTIANAVEETLRFQAPSPVQGRRVATEVRLHGAVIPAMSKVLLLNGSANRDEREFIDADCYDVTRRIDRHLAFGYGIHHCLGAALARLEGRIALQEVLARFPEWEVDRGGVVQSHSSTVRGHHRIPIAV